MRVFILVFSCSFLIVLGQVLWKIAIDANGGLVNSRYSIAQNIWNLIISPYMLTGISIYIFATVFWLYLLGEYDYSYLYAMLSMSYIFSFIFSFFLFNETITTYKIIGILFIILGVVFISKSKG